MKWRQWFPLPTAEQLARSELEQAQRDLLQAESALEAAQASLDCYRKRVQRLLSHVGARSA